MDAADNNRGDGTRTQLWDPSAVSVEKTLKANRIHSLLPPLPPPKGLLQCRPLEPSRLREQSSGAKS